MKKNHFISSHLVEVRPWPFLQSIGLLGVTFSSIVYWHNGAWDLVLVRLLFCGFVAYKWWRDVCTERWFGWHQSNVSRGLRVGVLFFILSEVFFFFSFFWSYFHNCWGPKDEIGWVWPPFGFYRILVDPFRIPLLKTIILLRSGVTVTWCHHSILNENFIERYLRLLRTCVLGGFFLLMQVLEYRLRRFSVNSMSYGTVFFMLTGFHGMHVIVGTCCLSVCFYRLITLDINNINHIGFESSAWYWHFVDVVWLFLFFVWYIVLLKILFSFIREGVILCSCKFILKIIINK